MFEKAVKRNAKLRLAISGPAGAGKTYTLLTLATELAGDGGKIAYVDTEHGSASKYADLFSFDVIEPEAYDPRDLVKLIDGAVERGYAVVCIDSLSHYWMGVGGELEMVDASAKRSQSGNSFAAWKTVTPFHNSLVDKIIGAKIHVLVSMRTKTEWVIETDSKGKKVPRKIGLAPVMREGIEFEFDVCGDMDQDNNLVVTKSRCPELTGAAINRPGKPMADVLVKWLGGVEDRRPDVVPLQPAAPVAVSAPYHMVPAEPLPPRPWSNFAGMIQRFAEQKERVGGAAYYEMLTAAGVEHSNQFRLKGTEAAIFCFGELANLPIAAPTTELGKHLAKEENA